MYTYTYMRHKLLFFKFAAVIDSLVFVCFSQHISQHRRQICLDLMRTMPHNANFSSPDAEGVSCCCVTIRRCRVIDSRVTVPLRNLFITASCVRYKCLRHSNIIDSIVVHFVQMYESERLVVCGLLPHSRAKF